MRIVEPSSTSCSIPKKQPVSSDPRKDLPEALRLLDKYPLVLPKYEYGTSGFRYTPACVLDSVMVRVGILAAIRSSQKQQAVGVMITASHNSKDYNGVKIADPNGGMIARETEEWFVRMVNDDRSMKELILAAATQNMNSSIVHIGRDTRSHSELQAQLVMRASRAMGATIVNHELVTTPMLRFAVLHSNPHYLPLAIPPRPQGYLDLILHSYRALLHNTHSKHTTTLMVDCACGVGYPFVQAISDSVAHIIARNGPMNDFLNDTCGSEFVQKQLLPPKYYDSSTETSPSCIGASLDGDADRIVFYQNQPFRLLDGDKILVLFCDFLQEQLEILRRDLPDCSIRLGAVQTAYANGASTAYLQNILGESNVCIAKTGVKYVHAAAETDFDIGVYFEANGHGGVLFGPKFYNLLHQCDRTYRTNTAYQRLRVLPSLQNQAVGDALSNLLLVDAILQLKQWTLDDWNHLYQDFPSRQCKVKVRDRSIVKTNANETRCMAPSQIQECLDEIMQEVGGRCFVRSSGTENVVRIYAEAPTRPAADWLAQQAAKIVYEHCGGLGDLPVV